MALSSQYQQQPSDQINHTLTVVVASFAIVALLLAFLFGGEMQQTLFIVIGGLIALVIGSLILVRPHWGGYSLVAAIMLNISDLMTESGYPSVVPGLVALTVFGIALRWIRTRHSIAPSILTKTECWIIAFITVCFLTIWVAQYPDAAYRSGVIILKDVAVLITIVFAIDSAEKWRRACWIVIVAAVIPAALGILSLGLDITLPPVIKLLASGLNQQVDGVWRFRLGGPIRRPNYYAQLLITVLPLILYQWVQNKHVIGKHLIGTAALVLIGASAFSYSRGAFVTLLFVLMLFALQQRVKLLHLGAGVLATTLLLFVISPSGYIERLQTILPFIQTVEGESAPSPLDDLSFAGRFSEMYSGILMFADYPLFGVGRANYPLRYQEYAEIVGLEFRDTNRDAHSLYVEIAAETGIVGLITFGGIVVTLFRALHKLKQQPNADIALLNGLTLSLIGFLTSSIFLHDAYLRFFWLFVALALVPVHLMHNAAALEEARILQAEPQL